MHDDIEQALLNPLSLSNYTHGTVCICVCPWQNVSFVHMEVACDDDSIADKHKHSYSYSVCNVPAECASRSVCLTNYATMMQSWTLNLPRPKSFPATLPEHFLPFSTLASRCMRGSHTKHWGGGSDISVSRKVLRETFFCWRSVQRRAKELSTVCQCWDSALQQYL